MRALHCTAALLVAAATYLTAQPSRPVGTSGTGDTAVAIEAAVARAFAVKFARDSGLSRPLIRSELYCGIEGICDGISPKTKSRLIEAFAAATAGRIVSEVQPPYVVVRLGPPLRKAGADTVVTTVYVSEFDGRDRGSTAEIFYLLEQRPNIWTVVRTQTTVIDSR